MAEIELVIKIPEEEYEMIVNSEDCGLHTLTRAVARGIILPKGHDRLIDAKKLRKFVLSHTEYDAVQLILADRKDCLPTIIEADKGD